MIIVGQGARGAVARTTASWPSDSAHRSLTTFRAKGLLPDTHPLGAGVLGRSGTPVASWLMNEADLLLVVGASFANHTGIAPYKPIVQVDDAPSAIGRFHAVDVGVLGDAAVTLRTLIESLRDGAAVPPVSAGASAREHVGGRPAPRRRGPLGDLARGEGPPRRRRPRPRGRRRAAVFAALSEHCPRRRGHRGRRRQPRLLVRPLLRERRRSPC